MILPHHDHWPKIHETVWIAPSADVIGEVTIGAQSSIWFQVVVRGDVNTIEIGARTNVQDHSMLHVTRKIAPLKIGDEVTVGHRVTLHGCTIGNRVLIGMGAIILDHAVIGDDCIIGAGALITKGTIVPAGSLVMGVVSGKPAVPTRALKEEEILFLKKSAENYVQDSLGYSAYVQGPKQLGQNDQDLQNLDDLEEGYPDAITDEAADEI